MLKYNETGRHEVLVVGLEKPSQLRTLLEYGLRHIRACLFRGRPLNSPTQWAEQKKGTDL